MTRLLGILATIIIAASLVVSAAIIRSGLLAIANQIREKPLPAWPERLHLVAGDERVDVKVGSLSIEPGAATGDTKVSIDNIRVTTPATQPAR